MHKWVVYTAAFGSNEQVRVMPQKHFAGIDFICFTDRPRKTRGWQQVIVPQPIAGDLTRCNRFYKLQPHNVLPQYERSIYIDSNYIVKKIPADFFASQMQGCNLLVFDHAQNIADPRNCVYDELDAILALAKQGKAKDDVATMQKQIAAYRAEGYPAQNGLISGGILIRNHLQPDIIPVMDSWWQMVRTQSKRDQLSFNYVAWKHGFAFCYLPGDSRRGNPYFYFAGKADKSLLFTLLKYKLRHIFTATK